MYKLIILSTLLFFFLQVFAYSASETDSLYTEAISVFNNTSCVNASIKRYQIYNGVIRESSGTFKYDRAKGAVYHYTSPSKFQINCTDSILYSIDPEKKQGFRFVTAIDDPLRYYDLDPFHRFFPLLSKLNSLSFLGSIDNLSIFCKQNTCTNKPEISVGIDREQKKVSLLEFFNKNGLIQQQVIFTYQKENLPETIVTKVMLGDSLLVDSLVVHYKKQSNKLPAELFMIPEGITWSVDK